MGNQFLEAAVETALEAGGILVSEFDHPAKISYKGEVDLVTQADRLSEAAIVDRLRRYFPTHAIVAEEGSGQKGEARHRWIIDPLDGTTNYAHGYPCFCVSIALEHLGVLEIGVIYDPVRDEMFAAERGKGATLNSRTIRVSEIDELNRAMVCTGFPYNVRERPDFARDFANFTMSAQAVRRDGSAAIDLAYVACGRFDGFWEDGLAPWDTAAGLVLIQEARGRVTNFDDEPLDIYTLKVLASNGLMHDAMRSVLMRGANRSL